MRPFQFQAEDFARSLEDQSLGGIGQELFKQSSKTKTQPNSRCGEIYTALWKKM